MSVKLIDKKNPIFLLDNYKKEIKNSKNDSEINNNNNNDDENLFVFLTHFNTLFKYKSDLKDWKSFFSVNLSTDLIHSMVGLFDICLPDMDLDTIYNSTAEKEAYTIFIISSKKVALKLIKNRLKNIKNKEKKIEKLNKAINKEKFINISLNDKDIYISSENNDDDFKLIYEESQSENDLTDENEENDENDDEDDEDFSQGYNNYIKSVYNRKLNNLKQENLELLEIGFEDQIIGAISFKIRYVDLRRIIHVTLLGVHKTYRGTGIGKHLIKLIMNPIIVGQYEAIVVHADFSASEFFKKFGFSDDSLLNIQWHSLEPEYTNCSLLTFVPSYSNIITNKITSIEIDVDIKLWQSKSVELHCFQLHTFQKMKMEISNLKETIQNQDRMMKLLMSELRDSNKEKSRYERYLKNLIESDEKTFSQKFAKFLEIDDENLELKIKNHFNEALKSSGQNNVMEYVSFAEASATSIIQAEFQATKRSIEAFLPKLNIKTITSTQILYFCEPFSLTKELKTRILSEGFTKNHRKSDSRGHGFYFATNPAIAAVYSNSNTLIVAEVLLGKICDYSYDITPQRESPPVGYHSVQVSSPSSQTNNNSSDINDDQLHHFAYFLGEEYVVFDSAQALPLGLVTYTIINS